MRSRVNVEPDQDFPINLRALGELLGLSQGMDARAVARTPTLPRVYSTTLVDLPGTELAVTILSAPRPAGAAVIVTNDEETAPVAATFLGGTWAQQLDVSELPVAILVAATTDPGDTQSVINDGGFMNSEGSWIDYARDNPSWSSVFEAQREFARASTAVPRRFLFARLVATETVVPFESSPPRGASLLGLASLAGATTGAAYFGENLDPMILIYLPTALVLIGGATGVARALNDGLYNRLMLWITGVEPSPDPGPDPDPAKKH